jgi:hypothetical protein
MEIYCLINCRPSPASSLNFHHKLSKHVMRVQANTMSRREHRRPKSHGLGRAPPASASRPSRAARPPAEHILSSSLAVINVAPTGEARQNRRPEISYGPAGAAPLTRQRRSPGHASRSASIGDGSRRVNVNSSLAARQEPPLCCCRVVVAAVAEAPPRKCRSRRQASQ